MDEKESTGAAAAPSGEQGASVEGAKPAQAEGEGRRPRFRRMRGFAQKHPVAVLATGAAAGLMIGVEFATGAAVAIAATLLVASRREHEVTERVRERAKRLLRATADLPRRMRRHDAPAAEKEAAPAQQQPAPASG